MAVRVETNLPRIFANGDIDLHFKGKMIRHVAGNDAIIVLKILFKLVQEQPRYKLNCETLPLL